MRKIFILQSVAVEINERKKCLLGLEAAWIGTFFFFSFCKGGWGFSPSLLFYTLRSCMAQGLSGRVGFSVHTHLRRSELSLGRWERARRGQWQECGVPRFTSGWVHFGDMAGVRKASQRNFLVFWCLWKLCLHYTNAILQSLSVWYVMSKQTPDIPYLKNDFSIQNIKMIQICKRYIVS